MRALTMNEFGFVSGGHLLLAHNGPPIGSQTFDDGSMLVYRQNGSLAGAVDTDGAWHPAPTTATPQLPAWVEAVPVIGPMVTSWNGAGQYNSQSGPGPLGSQNLPPSLPMMP